MAVSFFQQKRKQKYLILIFISVILIITIVVWYGFFNKKQPQGTESQMSQKKAEMDLGVLKNPVLDNLQLMEQIKPAEETEIGRENPFMPY